MKLPIFFSILFVLFAAPIVRAENEEPSRAEILISVAEQKLALVQDGAVVRKYPISTSKFGVGDHFGSYRTPVGKLRVCTKLGSGLPEGTVFRKRVPTREILAPNAPGRDPIVTRILWLEGLDESTANARERSIYIHGTPEEKRIGKPASYGCIRMKSRDVVELYEITPVGTIVTITMDRLPKSRGDFAWPEFLVSDNSGSRKSAAMRSSNFVSLR